MACHEEHCFTLDFALNHASWTAGRLGYQGWRSAGRDPFNRLTVYPDVICDWLYQKPPRARSAIDLGMRAAREALCSGRERLAAARLALTAHYVTDALAVSHTWLDFIADESTFESAEVMHKCFHDPIEYPVGGYVELARPTGGGVPQPFAEAFAAAESQAYELGRRIFVAFFEGKDVRPLVLRGVENTAETLLCLFEGVRTEQDALAPPESCERTRREWVLAPLLTWGEEVLVRPFQEETVRELKKRLGYEGGDIFTALARCTPHAREDGLRWQEQRREWRATTMKGILPSNPVDKVGAGWRPETAVRS